MDVTFLEVFLKCSRKLHPIKRKKLALENMNIMVH